MEQKHTQGDGREGAERGEQAHRARAQEDGAQRGNRGGAQEGETRRVQKRGGDEKYE